MAKPASVTCSAATASHPHRDEQDSPGAVSYVPMARRSWPAIAGPRGRAAAVLRSGTERPGAGGMRPRKTRRMVLAETSKRSLRSSPLRRR
jgi:hypothetical protein